MKTNVTFKHILLALIMMVSIAACKKDKTTDPPVIPPVEVKAMTITELKALSTGATVKVPDAKKITGIIISDATAKNIDSKTVILQEAADKPGVIVTFDAAQTFVVGDQLEVNVSNQTLAQVNGEVILQNIPAANAKKIGTGSITAKATTAADIVTNKVTLDGTLVTIAATELSGGSGKYTGTLTVKDASGTLKSNVLAGAAFENTAYPISVSSITGIVRISGNDTRIDIRKTEDVVTGEISRIVTEDFSNYTSYGEPNSPNNYFTSAGSWYNWGFDYNRPDTYGDSNFTDANKQYLYLMLPNEGSGVSTIRGAVGGGHEWNFKGVKKITVTFAGSMTNNLTGADYLQLSFGPNISNAPGTPEYFEAVTFKSPEYKTVGQFITVTYTMPTNSQLLAAGVQQVYIDQFFNEPHFFIRNTSKTSGQLAPILIDKIVFGFDK